MSEQTDRYRVFRVTASGLETDIGIANGIQEAGDMVTKDLMDHPECCHKAVLIHKESQNG